MRALVVYESIYSNTRAVAHAIAAGLGGAQVIAVSEVGHLEDVDLLVVGGPTHMHGVTTTASRRLGATSAGQEGEAHVERLAVAQPGIRRWLRELAPGTAHHGAAFDTRLKGPRWATGSAAKGIARSMRHHGIAVIATESFLVAETAGPLEPGEQARALAWGRQLLVAMSGDASPLPAA